MGSHVGIPYPPIPATNNLSPSSFFLSFAFSSNLYSIVVTRHSIQFSFTYKKSNYFSSWINFILIITTSFVTLNIMVGIDSWTHCTYGESHHRLYPGFYYIFIFDCSSREGLPAIF